MLSFVKRALVLSTMGVPCEYSKYSPLFLEHTHCSASLTCIAHSHFPQTHSFILCMFLFYSHCTRPAPQGAIKASVSWGTQDVLSETRTQAFERGHSEDISVERKSKQVMIKILEHNPNPPSALSPCPLPSDPPSDRASTFRCFFHIAFIEQTGWDGGLGLPTSAHR